MGKALDALAILVLVSAGVGIIASAWYTRNPVAIGVVLGFIIGVAAIYLAERYP